MLIDQKGMIAFKGHPANRPDLEKDFDTLLSGGSITGAGCEAAGVDEGEEAGGKEMDSATVMKEIDDFKTVAAEFQKDDELKAHAKAMPRCFCVMVYENTYNPYTGKSKGDFKNYRVLVGPQDKIDAMKAKFEEKVKGSFEVVLREHAV